MVNKKGRSKKNRPTGHITFKKARSGLSARIGFHGEELTAYKLGSNTIYLTKERAALYKERVAKINKTLAKDASEKNVAEARKLREDILEAATDFSYEKRLEAFLSNMPTITNGMARYLVGKDKGKVSPARREQYRLITEFVNELTSMSSEDMEAFYYENYDMFESTSRWYKEEKEKSGRMKGEEPPEGYESWEEYDRRNIEELNRMVNVIKEFKRLRGYR